MSGPLSGIRVVELGGIGPAPFCGMVLADLGADVIRVDRANAAASRVLPLPEHDVLNRGKRSLAADLKTEDGVAVALDLIASADALIEGFRPGVTEKLGLGPAQCLTRNQTLVYGRMTGWGQEGPLAAMAGHDIDYIAVSGALHSIGNEDEPFPPLNLVGDFGGGGMLLLTGVLAALLNARESGEGQVVDAAMVDGSALLMASHHGFAAEGWWDGTAR
ncbi:MAG: CaiB/BaiF CoA-transferase family protein, partial [Actinomycetota bacterium]|nr:CaiB/BaiF CoA-transferase family protein [Actinomycetota bacterium]